MMRTITETYQIQEVSDKEAEVLIKEFLLERKKKGIKSVGIFDFMDELKLPPEQINKIMEKLEKEGVVKESD